MTPEQDMRTKEILVQLMANRDESMREVAASKGEAEVAALKAAMEESADHTEQQLQQAFGVSVADHPLLVLALTQLVGAEVMHVMGHRDELSSEELVNLLMHRVMGGMETLAHLVVRQQNAG